MPTLRWWKVLEGIVYAKSWILLLWGLAELSLVRNEAQVP